MAYTLNRRLAQLVDSNGQLNTGKIPNDYISSDHIADNVITSAMLHTGFTVSASNVSSIDTDDVSEGSSNLYFTNARVESYLDSNGITFPDNVKAVFGAGSDLEIYHDGSNSIINDAGTGTIRIQTGGSNQWEFNSTIFKGNDNRKIVLGDSSDLQIYHDGSHSRIVENGTGNLIIQGTNLDLADTTTGETFLRATSNDSVEIYYNGSKKFETTDTGVEVTGNSDVSGEVHVGNNNSIFAENVIRFKPSGAAYIDHNTTGQVINFRVSNSSALDTTPLVVKQTGIDVAGDLAVTGDLNITGDINSVSVTDLDVVDKTITLGKGQTGSASTGSGIIVDGSSANLLWDNVNDRWEFNKRVEVTGEYIQITDSTRGGKIFLDSAGSGNRAGLILDIDASDGIGIGSDYLLVMQDGVNDASITVPGSGTGNLHFKKSSTTMATLSPTGLTVNGIGTFDNNGIIGSASNRQLQIRDSDDTNMNMYMIVEKAADSGTGAGLIQVTETGVSNDRDLYIQGHGGATVIGSQSISGGANKLTVSGNSYFTGNVGIGVVTAQHKLDVEGGNNVLDIARFGSSASDNSEVTIGYFDANVSNGIAALTNGSDFGGLIQGGEHGRLVLGIRDNDASDSLDIISGGGNFMSDSTYDTLVASFRADGRVGFGVVPEGPFHISHSTDGQGMIIDHTTVGGYSDIMFRTKQNDGNQKVMNRIRSDMVDGSSGGEDSQLDIIGMYAGSEKLGIRLDRNTSTYISSQTTHHFQGHADTAGANYHELGSWTSGQGGRITIRINGAIGFSNNFDHAGETVIHGTISNNADFEGFFYGVGSNSTATAVAISNPSTGVYKIFVLPGAYGSYEAYVHVSSGTVWTPKTSSNNTGSSSLPSGAVGLQSEFGVNISGTRKLLLNSSGNLELSNGLNSTAGTVQFADGGSSFDSSDANGYARFTHINGSAQVGLFRAGGTAGGAYIGADGTQLLNVYTDSFARRLTLTSAGRLAVGPDAANSSFLSNATILASASADAQVVAKSDNTISIQQDAAWASNIFFGAYHDGTNQVYGASGRGAFKILALHDGDTSPQHIAIYGANASSGQNTTVSWNSVGFAQDEDGNVGIGGTAPANKLHVFGGSGDSRMQFTNTASGNNYSDGFWVGMDSNAAYLLQRESQPIRFYTAATQQASLESGGNFGIGTNLTPTNRLHVHSGGTSDIAKFANNNGSFIIGYTGGLTSIDLATDGEELRIRGGSHQMLRVDKEGLDIGYQTLYSSNSASLSSSATSFYLNSSGTIGTGKYLLSVYLTGGGWYSETWTGIMSWYSGTTNSGNHSDIYMTGMGHAPNGRVLAARVLRTAGNNNAHALQLWDSSGTGSSNHTITIRAAKLMD